MKLGDSRPRSSLRAPLLLATFVVSTAVGDLAASQPHGQFPTTISDSTANSFQPQLMKLPENKPRSKEAVTSFIDQLSSADALFEVIVGQGRLLTLKEALDIEGKDSAAIAIGDPDVADFVVVGPRHIRVIGLRIGCTDLSIITPNEVNYTFRVQVVADLGILRARLAQSFPDASLKLAQFQGHVILEGQARDSRQVAQIVEMVEAFLESVQSTDSQTNQNSKSPGVFRGAQRNGGRAQQRADEDGPHWQEQPQTETMHEASGSPRRTRSVRAKVINLLRVPGPQQVLLKVQVAELNRTAFREIGFSFLFQDGSSAVGSNIGRGIPAVSNAGAGVATAANFARLLNPLNAGTTVFGVFKGGNFDYFINALRRNRVLKVLAEPNVVAMNGQPAKFLAGGEFPVPVPQSGVATGAVTIQYKKFGVGLNFVPFIRDDETIRLQVAPEVSSIDFSLGIETAGTRVPALNTREVDTVVELREGQTLAIAGLLQVTLEGNTDRIPGLGDLKVVGPFFSNTSSEKVEKELIVLVTPYLVEATHACDLPPLPGSEVDEPTDLELYLLGRIEGKTLQRYRSTTRSSLPRLPAQVIRLERKYIQGPHGFSY